jgi:hypothetical protein
MSVMTTCNPAAAQTCAMPLPMVPAPMTPTISIIAKPFFKPDLSVAFYQFNCGHANPERACAGTIPAACSCRLRAAACILLCKEKRMEAR